MISFQLFRFFFQQPGQRDPLEKGPGTLNLYQSSTAAMSGSFGDNYTIQNQNRVKNYNAKQYLTICLRVLRVLLQGRKGGLWASPRFTVPSGNVAWLSCQLAVA